MPALEEDDSLTEFRIFETEQFEKDLQHIAKSGRTRITEKLKKHVYPQLRHHPHFGPNIKKLRDYYPETWRYRIGSWKFFYEIDEDQKIVFMISASHRSTAY